MSIPITNWLRRGLLALLLATGAAHAAPGFIVAAPDRGFTGNEEVRDAYAEFVLAHPAAQLVFVTGEDTLDRLDEALATLRNEKVDPVVVLPFYLTSAHPDMALLARWAAANKVRSGRPFGRSAPALAALKARLQVVAANQRHQDPGTSHMVMDRSDGSHSMMAVDTADMSRPETITTNTSHSGMSQSRTNHSGMSYSGMSQTGKNASTTDQSEASHPGMDPSGMSQRGVSHSPTSPSKGAGGHGEKGRTSLVLLGYGARTDAQAHAMEQQLDHLLRAAAQGLQFDSMRVRVWTGVDRFDRDAYGSHLAALRNGDPNPTPDPNPNPDANPNTNTNISARANMSATPSPTPSSSANATASAFVNVTVLPFNLGPDLDSMMGLVPRLKAAAPSGITVLEKGTGLLPAMASWLNREAARWETLAPEKIGVLIHAHGARFKWNETMRQGAAALARDHPVEFAFSMGDPATLEHAVRHLEERGAEAIVLVRVFAMKESFRDGIRRFIGDAWESCDAMVPADQGGQDGGDHGGHQGRQGGQHGGHHGGHGASGVEPLLRTRLPIVTVGGLEDDPLFAKALYERARSLSTDPSRETVILVAHGVGNEAGNKHWRAVLESIRGQVLEFGANRFRAVNVALWSEDWPELRQSAIEHVRALVERAGDNGGRALVIPARTLGQGPAEAYLKGLNFTLGEGFSPHPLFADWLRQEVREGIDQLHYTSTESWVCSSEN